MQGFWRSTEAPREVQGYHPEAGDFNIICTLLVTIGKRYQDAGQRNLCTEAGDIADAFVAAVLDGRMYNHVARLLRLLYKVFMRLAWKGFLSLLEINHSDNLVHLEETLTVLNSFFEAVSQAAVREVIENKSCEHIFKFF